MVYKPTEIQQISRALVTQYTAILEIVFRVLLTLGIRANYCL